MTTRWQMHRMGFINFWLYDEEIFDFADGKLFLRGSNGTGKSITTQSFIPFILDGDKSPERLDPFGSRDRKMEYYFLGNGERDDVTGYLFLEFEKGDTGQFRTIGIGQRAQRGKPMTFWGFVILDGRRIGHEINLAKEVGTRKIPLLKQELKKVLGEENFLVDRSREYMELVNKYLFGFPRVEQYQQYINLLLKVRSSKLSRQFKPSRIYEILNESLQTLSDEDLRSMVDAMEKMDDIQSKLEGLKAAFKDLQRIKAEYERYNRYMLSRKALAYRDAKMQNDAQRQKFDALKHGLQANRVSKTEKENEISRFTNEIKILEKERDTIGAADLISSVERLKWANDEKADIAKQSDATAKKVEEYRAGIQRSQWAQDQRRKEIDLRQYQIDKLMAELAEINETLQLSGFSEVKGIVDDKALRDAFRKLKREANEYADRIAQGLNALRAYNEIELKLSTMEEKLDELNIRRKNAADELERADRMEMDCRDAIVDAFHHLKENFLEIKFSDTSFEQVLSQVKKYGGARDFGAIKKVFDEIHDDRRGFLLGEKLRCVSGRKDALLQYEQSIQELNELKSMKSPVPPRREGVMNARKILLDKGIQFLPFYEAVEFRADLTEAERALLEAQLLDAGILDACIVSSKDDKRAKLELANLSDTVLSPMKAAHTGFDKLTPGDLSDDLRDAVQRMLGNIHEEYHEGGTFMLRADGYFRNGIVEGHSLVGEQASYIGAQARRRKLLGLIAEKEAACKARKERLDGCEQNLLNLARSLEILQGEYNAIPDFDDLDQAIGLVKDARDDVDRASRLYREQETEVEREKERKKKLRQEVFTFCRALPFEQNADAFQEAKECVNDVLEGANELETQMVYLLKDKEVYKSAESLIEKDEAMLEEAELRLRENQHASDLVMAEIRRLEEFLNRPENKERASRLAAVERKLTEVTAAISKNTTEIAVLEHRITEDERAIEDKSKVLRSEIDRENRLHAYYREELNLGLVIAAGGRDDSACLTEAVDCLSLSDKTKSVSEVVTSLLGNYQKHNSTLSSYGTAMEDCFEDAEDPTILRKRQRIVSVWRGKKLYLNEFHEVLAEAIESNELLIRESDRKLFEDILADTLSRKLNHKIMESKRWIEDMSALMLNIDTSMGLRFSLAWKPRAASGERELDTKELEKLLSRNHRLLTNEDIEKVTAHFRSKIATAKQIAEDNGNVVNYMDLVRDALDYRTWFEFRMFFHRDDVKKELTDSAFNTFSGGEKAMAMYVPLFAAVNAQCKKAEYGPHPRIIALDEAFAGVDDKNISSMFALVHKLDFDYIMNSQSLWGCYETVKSLRIAELLRDPNSDVVLVIYYHWNGRARILLDEEVKR